MFEYLGETSSTMKTNKFHGSMETIAHGESNLIFERNYCLEDVLFLGNEKTKLKVRMCRVEGEFRFFNDSTLERVLKYLYNIGNSIILKNQIKNKSLIKSNERGQSIAMFGKNVTKQLIRKRKYKIRRIFESSVVIGSSFIILILITVFWILS